LTFLGILSGVSLSAPNCQSINLGIPNLFFCFAKGLNDYIDFFAKGVKAPLARPGASRETRAPATPQPHPHPEAEQN